VVLQEVHWQQARRIARALDARSWRWGFKHWPLRTWPEGMAVIGVARRVHVRTRALSHRWRLWSWRRRIVQVAAVEAAGGPGGASLTLVNVHLTPHGRSDLRVVETATVLGLVAQRTGAIVVAGDLNERPDGAIHRQLAAVGLRDGSGSAPAGTPGPSDGARPPDPLPTNWRGWRRGTTKPPTRQLDFVYVSASIATVEVHAPRAGDEGFERFSRLSDHLPVTAVLGP
jgi:endonuclease/exonuclease/phosphatase family metal-dependent hydrolase